MARAGRGAVRELCADALGRRGAVIVNAIPVDLAEGVFHLGWASGMFVIFTLYYVAFEEIHWRTHVSGWLPPWLRFAARQHLLHHAGAEERFNVFLPVFDWLLGTGKDSQFKRV